MKKVLSDELVSACRPVTELYPEQKCPPLVESGGSLSLEIVSIGKAAFPVEVAGDGTVGGGEHLQTSFRLSRNIARFRRRNGSCGFSALLFAQRPVTRRSQPLSFNPAPQDIPPERHWETHAEHHRQSNDNPGWSCAT
ncbi:hypothetical protein GE300_03205 [Rhodobacteraceae bacterium 2CG4]|uniref:Uncharacterized protein n=1 Tax=Halovulum marinum TaxID=2662447 RepID=A0A6L5YWR0_9RHOB|nr:hypothetical protein [Halovulum marinum]MSU88627.1 hypothetical protein [Halovulum marinum]